MRRREFLSLVGGIATVWPLATHAQQPERVRRIGVLSAAGADQDGLSRMAAFLQGLALLGWTDGRNVRIEYRWGDGNAERIRKHAAELVALALDVIVVGGSAGVVAALQTTQTIPIVFVNVP